MRLAQIQTSSVTSPDQAGKLFARSAFNAFPLRPSQSRSHSSTHPALFSKSRIPKLVFGMLVLLVPSAPGMQHDSEHPAGKASCGSELRLLCQQLETDNVHTLPKTAQTDRDLHFINFSYDQQRINPVGDRSNFSITPRFSTLSNPFLVTH